MIKQAARGTIRENLNVRFFSPNVQHYFPTQAMYKCMVLYIGHLQKSVLSCGGTLAQYQSNYLSRKFLHQLQKTKHLSWTRYSNALVEI